MEKIFTNTEMETSSKEMLQKMNAYWRTTSYLSVVQTYLYNNLLLKEPLKPGHVKSMMVGALQKGKSMMYTNFL